MLSCSDEIVAQIRVVTFGTVIIVAVTPGGGGICCCLINRSCSVCFITLTVKQNRPLFDILV